MQNVVGKQHVILKLKCAADFECHQSQVPMTYVALIMNLKNAALVHYSESLPITHNVASDRHMILQLTDALEATLCELFLLFSISAK